MTKLTSKELTMITDALTYEGLICRKARAYSRSLTDGDLAGVMARIADDHEKRYNELLAIIGG